MQAADVGSYLVYCVTPRALTGTVAGVEACSSATADQAGGGGYSAAPQVGASVTINAAGVVVAPIPTLSEWGAILLSALLAMFGLAYQRRRR